MLKVNDTPVNTEDPGLEGRKPWEFVAWHDPAIVGNCSLRYNINEELRADK